MLIVFFHAEDGVRVLVRSRGLGDVCKSQILPVVLALLGYSSKISLTLRFFLAYTSENLARFRVGTVRSCAYEHQNIYTAIKDRCEHNSYTMTLICLFTQSDAVDDPLTVYFIGRRDIKHEFNTITSS